jgi:hypothetical protein
VTSVLGLFWPRRTRSPALDKLPLAGRGRCGECQRFFSNLQEGTLFAANSECYDALLVSCPLSVVSRQWKPPELLKRHGQLTTDH